MVCYHPLYVFQSDYINPDTGHSVIIFPKIQNYGPDSSEFRVDPPSGFSVIRIPCGKCLGCMLKRSREWALRCMHEYKTCSSGMFLTLTFDDDKIIRPDMNYSLCRRDIQLFIKRLRKEFSSVRIRFFYCGEYGARRFRPHYHLLVFGLDFSDKYLFKVQPVISKYSTYNKPVCLYRSPTLERLWPYGFSTIGELNFRTAAYTARYCLKKSGVLSNYHHYRDKTPEFIGCSLKPGLGYDYFVKYYEDFYSGDFCFDSECRKMPVPRYYDKLLERIDPDKYSIIKNTRKLNTVPILDEEYSKCRLFQKEQICKDRLENLIRSYEAIIESEV